MVDNKNTTNKVISMNNKLKPCSLTIVEVEEFFSEGTCYHCGFDKSAHGKDVLKFTDNTIDLIDNKYYQFFKSYKGVNTLDEDEIRSIFKAIKIYFTLEYQSLKEAVDRDNSYDCNKLKNQVVTSIFSKTRNSTYLKSKIFLDGKIANGKDSVQIYRGYHEKHKQIVAIKLYPNKNSADKEFENLNQFGNSEFVLAPIQTLEIEHPTYLGIGINSLVMPYLPAIASDFLKLDNSGSSLPEILTLDIIKAMYEVAILVNEKSMVFCDFKLQNVGITLDGKIKVFDFGAITNKNTPVKEYTEAYCLDYNYSNTTANEKLDMICIAMSAVICANSLVIGKLRKVDNLEEYLRTNQNSHIGVQIAKLIVLNKFDVKECYKEFKLKFNK